MSVQPEARYGIDPYLDWVKKEGLAVAEDYGIDLFEVETSLWPRYGVKSAVVHIKTRGDFANMFLFDIPPRGSTLPQQHLYEEVVYVLEGSGSTQFEFADGRRRSVDWGPRSLFIVPLNARHRHFNGHARGRALIVSTTNLPLVMNTFLDERFIFGCDFEFFERIGKDVYFRGGGDLILVRPGNDMWETNFVPDLASLELREHPARGAEGGNINIVFPGSGMHAHVSEIPAGTYKKAHRHRPGFHDVCVVGKGYTLQWFEGEQEFQRIDWKHGTVFPLPADRQFHQHFNTGDHPARYVATGVGSVRYPFTVAQRRSATGLNPGDKGADWTSTKEGGDQIDYDDQDPRIHRLWLDELGKNKLESKMEKFFPSPAHAGQLREGAPANASAALVGPRPIP